MVKALASGILAFAVAISFPLASGASRAASSNSIADIALGTDGADIAAGRIDDAFALLRKTNINPVGAAAAVRSVKGDLPHTRGCAGATWPNIDASCLLTADGSPAPHVRTITIDQQIGVNTAVLLRLPAAEVAWR